MQELINKVVKWGQDRGLDKVGHEAQARYTLKETAELLDAYADKDIDAINDAIGDILVTLIVGASNDDRNLKRITDALLVEEFYKTPDVDFTGNLSDLIYWTARIIDSENSIDNHQECCAAPLRRILCDVNTEFNQDVTIQDCLQLAYNEIKNRTGKLVNGQFIKDN